jgi:iron(III) transport system substrate-binding protein
LKIIRYWQAQLEIVELSSILKANALKTSKKDSLNQPFSKSIGVIFPNQTKKGCFYNITGAGIYRYARNPIQARKLVEFLASKRAQYQFAAGRFEYPVVKNINPHYLLDPFGKYRARFVLNN